MTPTETPKAIIGSTEKREPGPDAVLDFRTPRLLATPMNADHQPWLDVLHQDPEVMAHFGGTRSGEAQQEWIDNHLRMFAERGLGVWILRPLDSDGQPQPEAEPIGRVGLRPMSSDVGIDIIEIGYTLARSAWGQGYATEAAQAIAMLGFGHYQLSELGAIAHINNVASQRVLLKAGFVPDPAHHVDLIEGRHLFYRQGRPET